MRGPTAVGDIRYELAMASETGTDGRHGPMFPSEPAYGSAEPVVGSYYLTPGPVSRDVYPPWEDVSLDGSSRFRLAGEELCRQAHRLWVDHVHFYSTETAVPFVLILGGGAVLANTSMDHNFRNWYQDDVRSSGTDDFARFWKVFGEGGLFIPTFACLAVAGSMLPDTAYGPPVSEFAFRATRAYLVGAPPMLLMQRVTGGSRPGENEHESRWRFFADNNGVSGHAFIGAVPFITAAQMVENSWLRGGLYAFSAFTAWSRANDDAHYLSQCILGWTMAYLACQSVGRTELSLGRTSHAMMIPVVDSEMMGVGLVIRR